MRGVYQPAIQAPGRKKPNGRTGRLAQLDGHDPFARYPPGSYATLQDGLAAALVAQKVGRNGWAVMVALCHKVYCDGRLGWMSAREISKRTGLSMRQVAHGMAELRDSGMIVPVLRRNVDGAWAPDRSRLGHVAQYRIADEVWAAVGLQLQSE